MDNCKDIQEILSAFADGEVFPQEQAAVGRHLETCPECRARLADITCLKQQLADSVVIPPEELTGHIMRGIEASKKKPKRRFPFTAIAAVIALLLLMADKLPLPPGGMGNDAAAPTVEESAESDADAGEPEVLADSAATESLRLEKSTPPAAAPVFGGTKNMPVHPYATDFSVYIQLAEPVDISEISGYPRDTQDGICYVSIPSNLAAAVIAELKAMCVEYEVSSALPTAPNALIIMPER